MAFADISVLQNAAGEECIFRGSREEKTYVESCSAGGGRWECDAIISLRAGFDGISRIKVNKGMFCMEL